MRLPGRRTRALAQPHKPGEEKGDPRIWGRRYQGPHPRVVGRPGRRADRDRQLPRVRQGAAVEQPGLRGERDVRERRNPPRDCARKDRRGQRRRGDLGGAGRRRREGHVHRLRGGPAPPHRRRDRDPAAAFLDGNFFLDVRPGSPSAPDLEDGARSRSPRRPPPSSSTRCSRLSRSRSGGPPAAARGLRHGADVRADAGRRRHAGRDRARVRRPRSR